MYACALDLCQNQFLLVDKAGQMESDLTGPGRRGGTQYKKGGDASRTS